MQNFRFSRNRVRDTKFVLTRQLDLDRLSSFPRFSDFSWEDYEMVIDAAIQFTEEVLVPISRDGDLEGATLVDGSVRLPESFHEAFVKYREQGWIGAAMNPEFGGQGLPRLIYEACLEYFSGFNTAFMGFPGLAVGAGRLIESFGGEDLKKRFVENLYSGRWGGTMCLTEPNAGSDLNHVSSRAEPDGPLFRIHGHKTFISSGDHPLVENIVHLVLARIDGEPEGTRGLSLFAVPKIWVDEEGRLGESNDVEVASLEKKMGMHASPTASLHFGSNGGCRGFLVGEKNRGLSQMFQLVNEARIAIGIQSMGMAATAYDVALAYARERVQGRPFGRRESRAVRIIEHEDVRRMLMLLKANVEGMRALTYSCAMLVTEVEEGLDRDRSRSEERLAVLTPIIKAYCSDRGFDMCSVAIQVLGGYGYLEDYPIERLLRDSKIQSIWEGTNYIQSIDLVGRKLLKRPQGVQELIREHLDFCRRHQDHKALGRSLKLLGEACQEAEAQVASYLEWAEGKDQPRIPWTATRFLSSLGDIVVARLLLEQALIAESDLSRDVQAGEDRDFLEAKPVTARFFASYYLPETATRLRSLRDDDTGALDLSETAF